MFPRICFVAAVVAATGFAGSAAAEIYKWTNADGSVGITDDASKIPPHYRDQAMREVALLKGATGSCRWGLHLQQLT